MAKWNMGSKNGMWKGGRVVDPRGYVLIRVGKDHPLADCRGYAYEHRLNAQARMKSPLRTENQIHHNNEQKHDNAGDNLTITAGMAEHRVLHRKPGSKLRLPGELNTVVRCACGCGIEFPKFDQEGRPRSYIAGHNAGRDEKGRFCGR
jgi:hypothetical protein